MTPNKIFVSFRGTKTFFEALSGIKFYRVPFPMFQPKQKKEFIEWRNKIIKGKEFNPYKTPLLEDQDIELHKGFLDEAILLYNDLAENLEKIIEDKKPIEIILCGHSLGGVLAHIIGIYLGFYMQDVVKAKKLSIHIITANAPPIGNKNFNLLVPYVGIKNFWRFYNFQDFVPHYGYLGTWIESKKFRHLDFMLKEGVADSYNSVGRKILTKIENTTVLVNDFGVNLNEFMDKIPESVKCNNKYIFHDLFVLDSKKKSVFI
jgi:predicted lipase